MNAPANLMEKARPTPSAASERATAARKRYHLGSIQGTPFQNIYLPATPETGTICFPQYTIFRSKPDARGQRIEMPQPGAYHDLTDEDVKAILVSCANRIVRWDARRQRPKIMHRESRGFRPSSGQEGQPLDEPLCNYVYLRPFTPEVNGPEAGGLFEPVVFAPIGDSTAAASEGSDVETPTAETGGAGVSPEAGAGMTSAGMAGRPMEPAGGPERPSAEIMAGKPGPVLRGAAAASAARKAALAGAPPARDDGDGYREVDASDLARRAAAGEKPK